ncbi:MAG: hypothetical protein KA051_02985 [Paludibacteraceae bacterium]|jgi:hypothetical protein|nr:hypothetical protein [Paludibacteraceae bacterium]
MQFSHNIKFKFWQRVVLLCGLLCGLSAPLAVSQNTHRTRLKTNPKAYTGKRAWWLDYQYFPELQKIGLSDDTIPDLRQRLSFYLSGGYAGMTASSGDADFERKFGVGFGGRYSYFFSKIFGFRSGLDFSYARSSSSMGAYSDYYYKEDEEHDLIRYDYSLKKLNETYNYYMLSVPVEGVVQFGKFNIGAGVKLGFPIVASYSQTAESISNEAYFPQYDAHIDDSWVLACGKYDKVKSSSSYVACPLLLLGTLDVEYFFKLNEKYSVGIGAYVDCTLGSSTMRNKDLSGSKPSETTVLSTSDGVPAQIVSTSILSSKRDNQTKSVVDGSDYFSAGIKLSFNLNWYGPPKPRTKPY